MVVGKTIVVDKATQAKSRPSTARVKNLPKSLYILARTVGASASRIPLSILTAIEKTGAPIFHGNTNLDNQRERKASCS
ncbi:hypothetical protein H5410_040926 [Solanum commersonii]|uniref:Uncharacterized protein n=1 Tax=Solanum commersonii TaxID=4109 RepID=A0A9J5XSY9_SOLCO|nr:hypothetical protein H5410_040926 [Solanum commersonii]